MKKILSIVVLFFIFQILLAEISVESFVNETKIGLQDFLQLTIEISTEKKIKTTTPKLPEIKYFTNRGSSSSSSSSTSIINGKVSSEITKSYIFSLQPEKVGKFIIPPISVKVGKENFVTDPITITIVEGTAKPLPPNSSHFQNSNKSGKLADNLFIEAEISKKSVYENEPILVEFKLFSRLDVVNLSFANDPNFEGFWKEDVFTPKNVNFKTVSRNGQRYNMMLLSSVALFPSKSGKLKIPIFELSVDVRTESRSFFDFGSSQNYIIKSKPKSLNVKKLPPTNLNTNAVGKFKMKSKISETELKVGDSFTYTLEISGSGNLKQFELPTLPEITHLRFMEPEIITTINDNKISGKKTIKYLVIAQEKGVFELPAIAFSYFDVKSEKYRTLKTDSYTISVSEGENAIIHTNISQTTVKMEGQDIGFIITKTNLEPKKLLKNNVIYWLFYLFLILLVPIAIIYAKERAKLSENTDYFRQKQANKILKKYLKKATAAASNNDLEFYVAAQNGLSNFLSDKLKIARGSSTEILLLNLKKFTKLKNDVELFFQKCNQARFMPGGFSQKEIADDFTLLKSIINEISKTKF